MRHLAVLLLLCGGSVFAEETAPPVQWDPQSATLVESIDGSVPFVRFSGAILSTQTIQLNGQAIPTDKGRFSFGLGLPDQNNDFEIRITTEGFPDTFYAFRYRWKTWPKDPGLFSNRSSYPIADLVEMDAAPAPISHWNWSVWTAEALFALGTSGGKVFSLGLGWAPQYQLGDEWTLGLGLDFMPMKSTSAEYFPVVQLRASVASEIGTGVRWEWGTGAQFWITSSALLPILQTALVFDVDKEMPEWADTVKAITVGYTYAFHSTPLHIFRLGARLSF